MAKGYDFSKVLLDICSLVNMLAAEKRLHFNAQMPKRILCCPACEEERLRQILLNVFLHVITYTDKGDVSLEVERIAREKEDILVFTFSAEHIDLERIEQDKLFSSLGNNDSHSFGLDIASTIAVSAGGSIRARQEKIFLHLPIVHVADCEAGELDRFFLSDDIKILIVDDKEINLFLLQESVKQLGIYADIVDSGRGCLNKLASGDRYDIIFMDYMMPELDGVETTRLIRMSGEDSVKNIPIIAITADDSEEDREKFLAAGMDDCLFKPVSRYQIADVLEKWLPENKRQATQNKELCLAWREFFSLQDLVCLDSRKGLANSGGFVPGYILLLKNFLVYAPELSYYLEYLASKEDFTLLLYVIEDCQRIFAKLVVPDLANKAGKVRKSLLTGELDGIVEKVELFCVRLENFAEELAETLDFKM